MALEELLGTRAEVRSSWTRTRWAAIGAAAAVTLGAGGLRVARADVNTGARPVLIAVTPTRILDTRVGLGLASRFVDKTPRLLQVTGSVPTATGGPAVVVPPGATGIVANVTVSDPSSAGFLSVRPGTATNAPSTSNLNFALGQTVPNSVTVLLPADGKIQLWLDTNTLGGTAQVLVDIVGYTDNHNHDDRYYTKPESDARVAPLPVITILQLAGNAQRAPSSNYQLTRTAGTFTKAHTDTVVRLTLSTDGNYVGEFYCSYQLRIDAKTTNGDAGLTYSDQHGATIFQSVSGAPFVLTGFFPNLAPGPHTVQVYGRSSSNCNFNWTNSTVQVIVEEYRADASSVFPP